MRRLFLPTFYLVANILSFGASAASSALYAGIITFIFVLYYSYAIKLPAIDKLILVVGAIAGLTTLIHGVYFGLFHKVGLSGLTRGMRLLNRAITRGETWFKIDIRRDLNADQYRELHRMLCYLPRENAWMSVAMVVMIVAGVIVYLNRWQNYSFINLIQVGVIAVIAGFIHAGFAAVITELVTGEMRTRVKQIMYEKKVEFKEISLSTVRSKISLLYHDHDRDLVCLELHGLLQRRVSGHDTLLALRDRDRSDHGVYAVLDCLAVAA
jgi:hypothetical protein